MGLFLKVGIKHKRMRVKLKESCEIANTYLQLYIVAISTCTIYENYCLI